MISFLSSGTGFSDIENNLYQNHFFANSCLEKLIWNYFFNWLKFDFNLVETTTSKIRFQNNSRFHTKNYFLSSLYHFSYNGNYSCDIVNKFLFYFNLIKCTRNHNLPTINQSGNKKPSSYFRKKTLNGKNHLKSLKNPFPPHGNNFLSHEKVSWTPL